MPINYSISPTRMREPARTASALLLDGYLAHPNLEGSFSVSVQEASGPAFLRQRGAIKKFYGEQSMISYCKKHAERGLNSDQWI